MTPGQRTIWALPFALVGALSACGGERMTNSLYKEGQDQQVTHIDDELPAVKITFRLVQDEDGYPGVGYESMWARRLPDGTFEIDNIPFYSYDVAVGNGTALAVEAARHRPAACGTVPAARGVSGAQAERNGAGHGGRTDEVGADADRVRPHGNGADVQGRAPTRRLTAL